VTFQPHPYQQDAMAHIYATRRCALWMPMGGGKTVTTLTALDNLSLIEDVFPVLVLAPLRVDGTVRPRRTWGELDAVTQRSWELNPTPREW
jgi:hypothetical protein